MKTFDKIFDYINKYDNFLIFGHEDTDADCVCSQLVLSFYLNSVGKKTTVFSQLPFTRTELKPYEKYVEVEVNSAHLQGKTAMFFTDCAVPERTGIFAPFNSGEDRAEGPLPLAVIDHHHTPAPEWAEVSVIVSSAPSTTFLILQFLKEAGYTPTPEESSLLFLGLCTDTGFFRHLTEKTGEDAFIAAAELCRFGASPNNAFFSIYGNRSPASRDFLALILSRIELHFHGQLLTVYEKVEDLKLFDKLDKDKDMMYQILMGTKGVKATASFREEEDGRCSVSLRTKEEDMDLSKAAALFGGGGHKKASGYVVKTTLAEAMTDFISWAGKNLF